MQNKCRKGTLPFLYSLLMMNQGILIFLLLSFAASPGIGLAQEENPCDVSAREGDFTISRGYSPEEKLQVKAFLNEINKNIPVGDQDENTKTWKVYTLPILKRKNLYFVRNKEKEIIGYAAMRDEENYLSWIAIKEEYRGKGAGNLARKLMERILDDYEKIELDVRSSNHRAIKFYENLEELAEVVKGPGEKYKNGEQGWVFTIGPKKKGVQVRAGAVAKAEAEADVEQKQDANAD